MGSDMHESLLKHDEDTITYCVPETEMEGDQWIEIGLFSWKLETVPLGTPIPDNPTESEKEAILNKSDGIGLRFNAHSQDYSEPRSLIKRRITDVFDIRSSGFARGQGLRYRIKDGSPNEIRQIARELVLATFAYWWWLDNESAYDPHVQDVRWENDQPDISHVTNDGVVVTADENRIQTPYTLSDIELMLADEYETPVETCEKRLKTYLQDMADEFDYATLKQAHDKAYEVIDEMQPEIEKTDARKQEDELRRAVSELGDISGIGRRTKRDLTSKFDSVKELQTAVETSDEELMNITQITPERRDEFITVLKDTGYWNSG